MTRDYNKPPFTPEKVKAAAADFKARKAALTLFGKQVDRETLSRFKREYEMAVEKKQETFLFDGQQTLVAFAKYLLQYAEAELGAL